MNAITQPVINDKPIQFAASAAFNAEYGGIEAAMYVQEALQALKKKPVDMLVFETKDGTMTIRSSGYDLATDSVLDEETVVAQLDSLPTKTFWLKLDNYGDHYVGTFLFPEDY